jgi:hypothetical protein
MNGFDIILNIKCYSIIISIYLFLLFRILFIQRGKEFISKKEQDLACLQYSLYLNIAQYYENEETQ